jgi:UDP:flavonoid glycosyltransferase YjiC (YdhE family)
LIDLVADKILGPPINEMCSKLNLPPAKYIMKNWIHSDDKVMGFFPDWFAEPQPDWPKNTELTDFVFFDEAEMKPMSSELEKFISQGEPPVIFTPGTAVKNADLFFKASIKACEILNTRAVFLSSYRDQIPDNLPKNIYYCRYAPFSKLFPHASTVVHHGGIGTCAQALRAGIPQLIVPFGFDQHDNSLRLRKLGVGSELSIKKYTGFTAADKLRALIENKDAYAQCKKISDKIEDNDSLTKICKIVERMVRR